MPPKRTKSPKLTKAAAIAIARRKQVKAQRVISSAKTAARISMRGLHSFIEHELVSVIPSTLDRSACDFTPPQEPARVYPDPSAIHTIMKKQKKIRGFISKLKQRGANRFHPKDHMAHGRKVHKALERAGLRMTGQLATNRKMRLDAQSTAVLQVMRSHNLVPDEPEAVAEWKEARIRTPVDVKCKDVTPLDPNATAKEKAESTAGSYSVVEYKTTTKSYSEYTAPAYILARALLPANAKTRIISHMDKDLIQAVCEALILKQSKPQLDIGSAYLAHTPAKGVAKLYGMPDWILNLCAPIRKCALHTASHVYKNPKRINPRIPESRYTPASKCGPALPPGTFA